MAEPSMNQSELARQWIDRLCSGTGLEGAWRLQLIAQRTRVIGTSDASGWLVDEAKENYVDASGAVIAPVAGNSVAADGGISPEGGGTRVGTAVKAFSSDRPMRIRRFAKGIPASCVDAAIRHLISKAPYTGITFNGTPIEGTYVPTHTWWEREDRDTVDRGRYVDNVYTLFQDLRDENSAEDIDVGAGGNCSEETSMRYEYDAFAVEDVRPRGQGYSTSIQSVSRNEDGTYDYAVVTRHALTQVSGPVAVKCDETETVEETVWRNLYGSPGSWKDDSGASVSVQEPCDRDRGVTYEVSFRENDDCTHDATVRKTTAKRVDPSGIRTTATIYQSERDVTSSAEPSPPPESTSASGGVIKTAEFKTRPDGLYDVTGRTVTETGVQGASVKRTAYLDGTVTETTSRNQAPSAGDAALSSELGPGESVEVRRTDGDLRDIVTVEVSAVPVGSKGADCRKTIFQHEHSSTSNRRSAPSPEHVAAASGGLVRRQQSRLTDRGTYDVTDETVQETPVSDAVVEKSRTLDGVVEQVTHRNQTPAQGDAAQSGTFPLGKSVTVRKTDGNLRDVTVKTVTAVPFGDKASECRKTIFQHDHSTTSNQASSPGGDVDSASGGRIRRRQARVTDLGTYDVMDETVTELPVSDAAVERTCTLDGVTTQTTDRNQGSDGGALSRRLKPGESVSVRKTEGGLVDVTVKTVDVTPVGVKAEERRDTQFQSGHMLLRNVPEEPSADFLQAQSGDGVVPKRTVRLTDVGTYDVQSDDVTEHPVLDAVKETALSLDTKTTRTTHRNQVSPDGYEPEHPGESTQVSKTDGGRYDITIVKTEPLEVGKTAVQCVNHALEHRTVEETPDGTGDEPDGYGDGHAPDVNPGTRTWEELKFDRQSTGSWRKTTTKHQHIRHEWDAEVCMELCYSYDVWFRNDTYDEYHQLLANLTNFIANAAQEWTREKRPPSSFSCNPDIHINEAQLYDGHIAVRAVWAAGSAGMTGETEGILAYVEYQGSFHRGFQAMGRGKETLDRLLNTESTVVNNQDDPKRALTHNASFDYNPDSNTWTCHVNVSMSHVNNNTENPLELPVLSGGGNREIFVEQIGTPTPPAGKPSLVQ